MAVAGKKKIFDGKYEILSIVGRGSRSVVYHARNITEDNSEVALKVLIENKKDKVSNSEKLRREALAMVSSHHPYVVRLDDFHSIGDICYLSMEYAAESDLRKYVAKIGGQLPVEQAELFLQQMTEGLEYIHRVGIIHRDIKPDNLLVVDSSSVRIGDFGVALLPGDDSSPQDLSNAVGTMDYMAPEVLEGIDYNQRSDLYSLGLSFYEMLSGVHPFAGASLAEQLQIRENANIKPLSELRGDIPSYISEAIMRALSYDPKDRFSSAKELLQHLRQKRVQKNPAPAPKKDAKKEDRQPPQLKVIPGNQGHLSPEPKAAGVSSTETAVIEITKISDIVPTPPPSEEPVTPREEVSLGSENDAPKAEAVTPEAPISGEEQVSSPTKEESDMQASGSSIPSKTPGRDAPLKDSRASRNPTVFIAKESAEKIRKETATRAPLTPKAAAKKKVAPKPIPQNNYFTIGTAALGLLLCILGWNMYSSQGTTDLHEEDATVVTSTLPVYDGEDLSFPNLPAGVYMGALSGLIPNSTVSVTAVSLQDRQQVALLLGLEGWTPTILNFGESAPSAVRVISNGMILEFSGQEDKGLIKGTYKNIVAGTQGNFVLKPVK